MILTYKYRVKDKHSARLIRTSRAMNLVWNFCNDTQKQALKWGKKWPTNYELQKLTSGSSVILGVSSDSIATVCKQYAQSRRQHKRPYLRYRGRKNLGWIPFKANGISIKECGFKYFGHIYTVWYSRPIPDNATICDGCSFSQDSRGRWYINLVVELPDGAARESNKSIGIDLGLKDIATLSTGERIAAPRLYRRSEEKLAMAYRAGKKRQVKAIHAKIANQRRDFLHKITTDIVKRFDHVVVGNVNAKGLARTKMAKSVHDVSWSILRNQLAYKCDYAGARYEEVNEAYSSQVCYECGCISAGSPKGAKGLAVREWTCSACTSVNDRDINAAKNILRSRHTTQFAGAAH